MAMRNKTKSYVYTMLKRALLSNRQQTLSTSRLLLLIKTHLFLFAPPLDHHACLLREEAEKLAHSVLLDVR